MAAGMMAGSDAKGDCLVRAVEADTLRIEIKTKAYDLVAKGIRTVVESTLRRTGQQALDVFVEDFGALDYVLAARTEAAVRGALGCDAVPLDATIRRRPTEPDRPRRSRLYAPGNNPRLLAGVEVFGADCVLLDLEDSVPAAEKMPARVLVKHLLACVEFPRDVWVRINGDLSCESDVREVLQGRPHGLCLPKAESAADVVRLVRLLEATERDLGMEVGFTKIMPIIETARGVLRCEEIATADQRIVMLAFGAEDFTRDVGARRSKDALTFARSWIVAAAAAAGIQASDTVFADLNDDEGLKQECLLARELGFDGKGAINPRQLEAIHGAFSPSQEDVAYAHRVVAAAEEAEREGSGAVALEGKMIDRPVLERAKRTLKYADQLAQGGVSG
jgi:citrate lyase subunit beta / citryl-CoA lyase